MRRIIKSFPVTCNEQPGAGHHEKGVALIVVILVLSFMLGIGLTLLTVTSTGPKVAGNVRWKHQVFNAAESGFDVAWRQINLNVAGGAWANFAGLYRTTYGGSAGFDDPIPGNANYFRRLTDSQIVEDIRDNGGNFIYFRTPLPNDNNFRFTVFLINDEAGGGTQDDMDALLVCIGEYIISQNTWERNIFARLEIELEIQ